MLTRTQDDQEIIERVAACDIGKAELMCCVRVPDGDHPGIARVLCGDLDGGEASLEDAANVGEVVG